MVAEQILELVLCLATQHKVGGTGTLASISVKANLFQYLCVCVRVCVCVCVCVREREREREKFIDNQIDD